MSLKELTANIIISQQLDRIDLPNDLKNYLNKYEFDTLLKKLKYEETEGRDDFGFPQNNIIEMLQHKSYVASNICGYERHHGELVGNILFPKIRYVLYYLQQEPNYLQRYPQKTHLKRCDGNCNCFVCENPQRRYIY